LFGLASIFMFLRIWARLSIQKIGSDDICMFICWILFIALTVVVCLMSLNGGVRHLVYLMADPANLVYVTQLNYLVQPLAMVSNGIGKISVGLTILRILGPTSRWRRGIIWSFIIGTIIFGILGVVFVYAQCKDPRALWNPAIAETTTCWDPDIQANFNLFLSSYNTFTDFLFALLPITIIKGLNMNQRKKIMLGIALGLSTFTGICAAVKTSYMASLTKRSDLTWVTFDLFAWAGSEIFMMIVCASVPALKPLWGRYVKGERRKGTNSYAYGYGSSSRYGYQRSQSPTLISRPKHVELNSMSGGFKNSATISADSGSRQGQISSDEENDIHVVKTFRVT